MNVELIMRELNGLGINDSGLVHFVELLNIELVNGGFEGIRINSDRMSFSSVYRGIEMLVVWFVKKELASRELGSDNEGKRFGALNHFRYAKDRYLSEMLRLRRDVNLGS